MGWRGAHRYRSSLLIACALCLAAGSARSVPPAETRAYAITHSVLGTPSSIPSGEINDEGHPFFVSRLDASAGFSARELPAPRPGDDWQTPPAGQTADRWISLVQVCFARRSDWLAFVFDGPGGAASFAVRRPALHIDRTGQYAFASPPGHFQFNSNAGIELALDFAMGMTARTTTADERPLLQVVVRPRKGDADAGQPDGLAGMMLDTSTLIVGDKDIAGITALSFAAACRLGWQPTSGRAESRLELTVSREVMSYTVTADYVSGITKKRLTKAGMQEEYLFDNLLTLFRQLSLWGRDVSDFCLLDPQLSNPLICRDGLVVVLADGDLRAFSALNGEKVWENKKPATYELRYTTRPGEDGLPVVWRFDYSNPIEVITRTGELSPAKRAQAEVTLPWGTSTDYAAARLAVASKQKILTYNADQTGWVYRAASLVNCGPCISSNLVLAGTDVGHMLALDWDSGATQWRTPTAQRLHGEITVLNDLALAGSFDGSLFAFARADGTVVWQANIGDLPLVPPQSVKGSLLVAGRNNIVQLLDPATGVKKAELAWPAWLTGVAVTKDQDTIICADQNGTVAFLEPDTLAVRRKVDLHERLLPGVLCDDNFPYKWARADDFGMVGTVAVVADRRGFIYLLPVEKGTD